MFISNNGEKNCFFFLLVKLTRQNYVERAQIEAKEKYKDLFFVTRNTMKISYLVLLSKK